MATRVSVYLDDGDVIVYHADCVEAMRAMPAASIDAIITDPPYGLEFMGKEWDRFGRDTGNGYTEKPRFNSAEGFGGYKSRPNHYEAGHPFQAWCTEWALEALRVLKPGGHLAAFGGTRTSHRLAAGIEDAGFEIRDTLAWLYGSGFPKSLDVSKAIDKAAGAEREIVGPDPEAGRRNKATPRFNGTDYANGETWQGAESVPQTAPATPEAEAWQGWGTALKPAHEPITLARKPLRGTVAANVLEHGTGALHIDACRIEGTWTTWQAVAGKPIPANTGGNIASPPAGFVSQEHPQGRWPANVLLDAEAAAILDQQTGDRPSRGTYLEPDKPHETGARGSDPSTHVFKFPPAQQRSNEYAGQSGGASRFFYTAKASGAERNDGLEDRNGHPTVKPVDLMRWLIRLLAPPGALILDPFAGSGTTGVAARLESTRCILIEREAEYLPIIAGRLSQQSLLS